MSTIEKAVERLEKSKGAQAKDQATAGEAPAPPEHTSEERQGAENPAAFHVDLERLADHGFLTPGQARSRLAEEYRMLKRPVLMNAFGKGAAPVTRGNLVMVSSALAGEGKTFTTLNLAMSMAMELDSTVLLVDSDVVRPTLSQMLGLDSRPGLIDVLLDSRVDLSDVIVRTDMQKLRVLPAGRRHANATELLASEQMEQITAELSDRYPDRIVLFDAPPLLVSSEAVVLSHHVGQLLLVVEAGRTPEHFVTEAISRLDRDKVVGTVLNKSRGSFAQDYYGGYYGYYGQ